MTKEIKTASAWPFTVNAAQNQMAAHTPAPQAYLISAYQALENALDRFHELLVFSIEEHLVPHRDMSLTFAFRDLHTEFLKGRTMCFLSVKPYIAYYPALLADMHYDWPIASQAEARQILTEMVDTFTALFKRLHIMEAGIDSDVAHFNGELMQIEIKWQFVLGAIRSMGLLEPSRPTHPVLPTIELADPFTGESFEIQDYEQGELVAEGMADLHQIADELRSGTITEEGAEMLIRWNTTIGLYADQMRDIWKIALAATDSVHGT